MFIFFISIQDVLKISLFILCLGLIKVYLLPQFFGAADESGSHSEVSSEISVEDLLTASESDDESPPVSLHAEYYFEGIRNGEEPSSDNDEIVPHSNYFFHLQARTSSNSEGSVVSVNNHGPGQCPICLDEMIDRNEMRFTPCGHMFHRNCIYPWIARSSGEPRCPVCREVIIIPD